MCFNDNVQQTFMTMFCVALYIMLFIVVPRLSSETEAVVECGSDLRNCSTISLEKYNCSRRMFLVIPCFPNGTTSIDLSQNRINIFGNSLAGLHSLRELNLAYNSIDNFTMNALADVFSLEVLDISNNKLNAESFPVRVFRSLHNIRTLSLHNNGYDRYPADVFRDLGSLQSLHIDVFEDFEFTEDFLNLKGLSNIEFYPRSSFSLHNSTFLGLSNSPIRYLNLQFSNVVRHPIGINVLSSFRYLKGIKVNIRLSCNVRDALSMLYGLRGLHLEYIDLSDNVRNWPFSVKVQHDDLNALKDICVQSVDLSNNHISELPFENFVDTLFSKCLKTLRIGYNDILAGNFIPLLHFLFYSNITDIDMSCMGQSKVQSIPNRSIAKPHRNHIDKLLQNRVNFTLHVPKSLRDLNASHIFMYDQHTYWKYRFTFEAPGLQYADLSYTSMYTVCNPAFESTYITDLRYLNLSDWRCSKLNPRFLSSIKSLESLIFRNSMLDRGLQSDTNGEFLRGLSALSTVDLSENNLQELNKNIFRDQKEVKRITLNNNAFVHIPDCISNTKNLQKLSLENNKISSLSSNDILILENLESIHLYLAGNRFDCECSAIGSLRWMTRNKHRLLDFQILRCNDNSLLMNIIEDMHQFELKCISTYWLQFSVTLLVLSCFAIITGTVALRYKVTLEYFYLRLRMFVNRNKPKTQSDGYTYDAFLSYSHHDTNWVVNVLYNHMTETLGQNVCLHDKDFRVGHWISDEIIRCIDESRHVVFIITRQFLDSDWSTYEMEMARMHAFRAGRTGLIIIMKESIPLQEMPKVLKRIWWRVVCLEWPNEENSESEALFWSKFKLAVDA